MPILGLLRRGVHIFERGAVARRLDRLLAQGRIGQHARRGGGVGRHASREANGAAGKGAEGFDDARPARR